ncbi:MAG: hypothetical protein JSS20_12595 [Proteobacteria bacterium]|nr:hypothetical protein [Pseudomonadota bacterium]
MSEAQDEPATLVTGEKAHEAEEATRGANGGSEASATDKVVAFVEQNPVLSAAAALAVGAAVAMAVGRRRQPERIDRQLGRAAKAMQRSFEREMKAVRKSDLGGRIGRMTNSFGDALSNVDLSPLVDQGKAYLEAMRRRVGA